MKHSSLVSRPSTLRSVVLLAVVLAGLFAGCSTGNDYGSSDVSGSFYYGVGVYDSWGYYGNPYYGHGGGAVIIASPPRPSQPIARPRMR